MADCGICLDVLRNPVSVPCGHVLCERCLRGHISTGADALKSACPTCRKPFHIATPDLTFVPQKYHDFILPSVRKIYMDIPSLAEMTREIDTLTQRLEAFAKENEHLRHRCEHYKNMFIDMESEQRTIIEREAEAQQQALGLREKYDSLKKKYREAHSRDNAYSATPSQDVSCRSSQIFDTSRDILPKAEELPVSLQELNPNPLRPKRALPKFRLSNSTYHKDGSGSHLVKRQRTHRHSEVGCSSRLPRVVLKGENEEDE